MALKKQLTAARLLTFLAARGVSAFGFSATVQERWQGTIVRISPYLLVFVVAVAPAVYLGSNHPGVFMSPDETARFVAAENFVRHGHFYIEDELTRLDTEVAAAPRMFTDQGDHAVPIYSLGTVAVLGVTHVLWGNWSPVILGLVPGLLFVFLFALVRKIRPDAPAYIGLALLGSVPLWYWTSRVYQDIALTSLFIVIGTLAFAISLERKSWGWFLTSSVGLAIGAAMRVPEAPFLMLVGIAFVLAFVHRTGVRNHRFLAVIALYSFGQIIGFIVPTTALNWWTYGSPLTFGYTLFYENNFPDRLAASEGLILSILNTGRNAVFPNPIDLAVLRNGLVYQVLLAVPLLIALGIAGIAFHGKRLLRSLGLPASALLLIAMLYMLVSRAAPGIWLALATEFDLSASIIRYWIPLYLVLAIGAALILTRLPKTSALFILAVLLISTLPSMLVSDSESIVPLRQTLQEQSSIWTATLGATTELDAVVIAGSNSDKWTASVRRTVGIWRSSATNRTMVSSADPETIMALADFAGQVTRKLGRPVYFILGRHEPENSPEIIKRQLTPRFLSLVPIGTSNDGALWKVVDQPRSAGMAHE